MWHVYPLNDLREHDMSPACWCRPELMEDDEGGDVLVHNSLDRRELYATGELRLH